MTLFFMVLAIGIFLIIGMAYDGTGRFASVQSADAIAEEIARTGAQCVDTANYLLTGQATVIDQPTAAACAAPYMTVLNDSGVTIDDVALYANGIPVAANGTEIHVDVTITRPVLFLSPLGFKNIAHGHATVKLTQGVTDSGG